MKRTLNPTNTPAFKPRSVSACLPQAFAENAANRVVRCQVSVASHFFPRSKTPQSGPPYDPYTVRYHSPINARLTSFNQRVNGLVKWVSGGIQSNGVAGDISATSFPSGFFAMFFHKNPTQSQKKKGCATFLFKDVLQRLQNISLGNVFCFFCSKHTKTVL